MSSGLTNFAYGLFEGFIVVAISLVIIAWLTTILEMLFRVLEDLNKNKKAS